MWRRPRIVGAKDFYAGIIYLAVGLGAVLWSREYPLGNATQMGPGYFPQLLGIVLLLIGLACAVRGIRASAPDEVTPYRLEPFLLILASIVSFALLIDHAGLVATIFVSVLLACFRRAISHPVEVFLTFVVLAAFSSIVFVHLFGMRLPLFWWN